MIRIGKMTDYALILTNQLVKTGEQLNTTEQLAVQTDLPFATVRKLLKQLVDGNVVESFRGTRGGYRLMKEAEEINLAEVITAIEGPISLTVCRNNGEGKRAFNGDLLDNWSYINTMVDAVFRNISLADMARNGLDKTVYNADPVDSFPFDRGLHS